LRNNFKSTRVGKVVTAGAALLGMGLALHGTSKQAAASSSGLGFYPTADIYPKGTYHLDVDTLGRSLKTDLATSVGLEYGFGPDRDGLFGRTEAGFDYLVSPSDNDLNGTTNSAGDRISLNVKTQLYNSDARKERVSLGISGLGKKATFTSVNLHLLGYKGFSFGRIHAGLWKDFEREDGGSDESGIQLGFDRAIGKKVIVGFDWRSSDVGFLAPCIIYNVNPQAGFELAIGRANDDDVEPRHQTYIAFDYNF
jgi:hypothetical protein